MIATPLLQWYDAHARNLPWRQTQDPYRVWLSEIILQQTTVATGMVRFEAFLRQFPTIHHLASASSSAVLDAWAGLGYYARARNLHKTAQIVAADGWPTTPSELQALPGIGAYTARAIAAIAFDQPVMGVDTHVSRILQRVYAPLALQDCQAQADALARHRPADIQQAMFDLGAQICRPINPDCARCPIQTLCASAFDPVLSIAKPKRASKPRWIGDVYAVLDQDHVLAKRRPNTGLLGGTLGLLGGPWGPSADPMPPFHALWQEAGAITHVFAHFHLTLRVWWTPTPPLCMLEDTLWVPIDPKRFPTVMGKALERASAART